MRNLTDSALIGGAGNALGRTNSTVINEAGHTIRGGGVIGSTIGYVGATGLATANHLHYEYRINGVHRNARTVELPQADPIPAEYRAEFLASVEPIMDELLQFKRTRVASLPAD